MSTDQKPEEVVAHMVSSRVMGKYLARLAAVERLINETDKHVHLNPDGSIAPECVLKTDLRQAIGVIYDGTEGNEQCWKEPHLRDEVSR